MSSSPGSAISPTGPGPFNNPKKRPSLAHSITSTSNHKGRQPSQSSGSHPLRQTSYPPQEASDTGHVRTGSFSPTVSSVGPSSKSASGRKKKRRSRHAASATGSAAKGSADLDGTGHPKKARTAAPDGDGDTASRVGRPTELDEEPDDDDADADRDLLLEGGDKMDEAAKKQEREHLAMLIGAFTQDQTERYETWRRVRLKKEVVRRITNQTLSQSVPPSIITTINGYTKVFIGELIERARDVQTEWLAASATFPSGEPNPHYTRTFPNGILANEQSRPMLENGAGDGHDGPEKAEALRGRVDIPESDRGPLMPDHLREALRRYKKDREGGSAGLQGMSLHGREQMASRTAGRRLFK